MVSPILYYMIYYMAQTAFGTFAPIYYKSIAGTDTQVGIILGMAPLITIASQFVWGQAADRARYKNNVLTFLLVVTAACACLLPVFPVYGYTLLMVGLLSFFFNATTQMSDAIVLENAGKFGWRFNVIRLAACLSFAVMSVFVGLLAGIELWLTFYLFACIIFLAAVAFRFLPKVEGQAASGEKLSYRQLFANRKIVQLYVFCLVIFLGMTYYFSFFSIYYVEVIGGSREMLGVYMLVGALSEVPFLLFAGRLVRAGNAHKWMLASAGFMAVRWLLCGLIRSPSLVLLIFIMHGGTVIIFRYCMAVYINESIAPGLKATAQATAGLVFDGVAAALASFSGGVLNDLFGSAPMFLFYSAFTAVAVIVFAFFFRRQGFIRSGG